MVKTNQVRDLFPDSDDFYLLDLLPEEDTDTDEIIKRYLVRDKKLEKKFEEYEKVHSDAIGALKEFLRWLKAEPDTSQEALGAEVLFLLLDVEKERRELAQAALKLIAFSRRTDNPTNTLLVGGEREEGECQQ